MQNIGQAEAVAVRRFERASLDLYVNKIVGDEPHLARIRDISAGGVYLYKLLEPQVSEGLVGLELKLPGAEHIIWAVGEVVREDTSASTAGVAVRFVRIAEHDKQRIRKYVVGLRQQAAAAA